MRRLVPVILVVFGLVACSSSSSPKSAPSKGNFDPAAASKALEALGRVGTRGTGTAGGPVQVIRTTIDYDAETMIGAFPPGVPTKPVALQYRAKDATAWFRRRAATGSDQIALGPDLIILHAPGKPPWVAAPRTCPYAGLVMRPWDPAWLLGDLAGLPSQLGPKVAFKPRPAEEIHGTTRRVFSARLTPRQQGYIGIRDVTVWVDPNGLPVRIHVVTPSLTRGTYDIAATKRPLTVTAPPDSQIEKANQPLPTASGPYTQVSAGTAGTVPYRVLRAPATDGGTCWKVESTPPYTPQDEPRPDGGVCIPPLSAADDPLDQFGFPLDATAETPYEMFGLLLPAGSSAEAVYFDGTRAPVPVVDGLALVTGPTEPVLGVLIVTLPGGEKLECAPGVIQTVADLKEATPAEARSAPWNCLPAE